MDFSIQKSINSGCVNIYDRCVNVEQTCDLLPVGLNEHSFILKKSQDELNQIDKLI